MVVIQLFLKLNQFNYVIASKKKANVSKHIQQYSVHVSLAKK